MTRKDYELIAATIREIPAFPSKRIVAEEFATALAGTNPRFDRDRFLKACGA